MRLSMFGTLCLESIISKKTELYTKAKHKSFIHMYGYVQLYYVLPITCIIFLPQLVCT